MNSLRIARSSGAPLCLLAAFGLACSETESPASPAAPSTPGTGGAPAVPDSAGPGTGGSGAAGGAGVGAAGAAGAAGTTTALPDLSPVDCAQCFPVEALPDTLRPKAEAALLAALDSEALYTAFGGLKPMSSGFRSITIPAGEIEGEAMTELRAIADALRCGGALETVVHLFGEDSDGTRTAELYLVRRPRFGETIAAHEAIFSPLDVTPETALGLALSRVDTDPSTKRFAAYGHLFGYPRHAVDFFVSAEESERADGLFVERDFVHVPVYKAATGAFTYAVPKGHVLDEDDQTLAEAARPILNAYKRTRGAFTSAAARKLPSLVRGAFDDGSGLCHPDHAAAFLEANGDDLPVCAKAGKSCKADADCCSNDCHSGHCH